MSSPLAELVGTRPVDSALARPPDGGPRSGTARSTAVDLDLRIGAGLDPTPALAISTRSVLESAALIAAVMAVVAVGCRHGLGIRLAPGLLVWLAVGALVAQLRPDRARAIAVLVGALALVALNPVFGLYFWALVAALAATRNRQAAFAATALAGGLLLPKLAFLRGYHTPSLWNWLNEPSLALLLFVSALWWRHRWGSTDIASPAKDDDPGAGDTLSFLLLYVFPTHATNPMVLGPSALWRPLHMNARGICQQLAWFVAKLAALVLLRHPLLAQPLLRELTAPALADLSRAELWRVVAASYVETYLLLAASADVPILIARLFGWPLPAPFRAPLVAWNPVELWRRWGIYNRQFLLRVVYFPLGGSRHHRYRNVVLTFLASALVLHSGWFGSKYLEIGVGGWRDEGLYFLLQALAVCLCLAVWAGAGKDLRSDRELRWSRSRVVATAATQTYSALAHVVILAQGLDLGTRFRLIGRCLGL